MRSNGSFEKDWRRFGSYMSYKRLPAGGPERAIHNRPKKTTVSGQETFYALLKQDKRFVMLKGHSHETLSTQPDGSYRTVRVRTEGRHESSWFWRWIDSETDGGAIVEIPEQRENGNRAFWKCLWVPEEFGQMGIGRRVAEALKGITDVVDGMAKDENAKHDGLPVNGPCFSLQLAPTPFHTEEWNLDQEVCDLDWSNGDAATKKMIDDSEAELPKRLTRLNWVQLRDWYASMGFVSVDGLKYHEWYDAEQNRIRKQPMMRARSYVINRTVMIYPEANAHYYMEEQENED